MPFYLRIDSSYLPFNVASFSSFPYTCHLSLVVNLGVIEHSHELWISPSIFKIIISLSSISSQMSIPYLNSYLIQLHIDHLGPAPLHPRMNTNNGLYQLHTNHLSPAPSTQDKHQPLDPQMPELVNDNNNNSNDDNIDHHDQDMNHPDEPPSPNPDIPFSHDPDIHQYDHGVHPLQPPQPEPFSSDAPKIPPGMTHVLHLTINGMLQFVYYVSHLPILYCIGIQCNEHGEPLPEGTPPPHQDTDNSPNDWTPYASQVEFELCDLLYRKNEMLAGQIDHLLQIITVMNVMTGGEGPFMTHKDLYSMIDNKFR